MSGKGFYIHLVPFKKSGTSYNCDFTVEVRHVQGDSLYAEFGGSCSEDKKAFITRVAKSLNTISASPVTKVLKEPGLKTVSLPLKELQKLMKTGIKYELVRANEGNSKLTKHETEDPKPKKKKRKGLFSSFS